jgi:hypothetical protein
VRLFWIAIVVATGLLPACTRSSGEEDAPAPGGSSDTISSIGAAPRSSLAPASPERLTLQGGTVLVVAGDTVTFIRVLRPPGPERDTLIVLVRGDTVVRLRPAPIGPIASPTAFQIRELLRHARIAERLPTLPPGAQPESPNVP